MVRGEKHLRPSLLVSLVVAPAVLVAALLLNSALQGCLPTSPWSKVDPDKSESTNEFISQQAKVWNDIRLQGAKYHRYTRHVNMKWKMDRKTSFRTTFLPT